MVAVHRVLPNGDFGSDGEMSISFSQELGRWLSFIVELFESGRGLPLVAVLFVAGLFLYLFVLGLSLIIPVWRSSRMPHH